LTDEIITTEDSVSILDRGLAYGDGLFETFAVQHGKPCLWEEHMERLVEGCHRLNIPVPDLEILAAEANEFCADAEYAVLKLILTRGTGGRGYRHPAHPEPWYGFSLHPRPSYPREFRLEGITARVCRTRLGRNPALAGIKHLNRLEQVLARNEWDDEYQEGLMLDTDSNVIEGTMSNLFLITEDGLLTPDLSHCGIEGVFRRRIIDWAQKHDVPCSLHRPIRLEDVFSARALFICNSIIGIWPIKKLEDITYTLDNDYMQRLLKEESLTCAN
jgi:4-amino-4-deoxychorismate lyase